MRHMATRRPKGGGRVAAPPPLPANEGPRERVPEVAAAPVETVEVEADEPVETGSEAADSETLAAEYAEPTASEAPEAAPEEES
jgi:hypothetical protein